MGEYNYKLSTEQKIELIQLYNTGLSSLKLATNFDISKPSVLGLLKRAGVTRRSINKFTPAQEKLICNDYQNKISSKELAVKYNVSDVTILNILHRHNVHSRTISEAKTIYHVDETAFDEPLSEKAAYFLGFLMADGSVVYSHFTPDISLRLARKDANIIYKYKDFLKTDYPVSFGEAREHGGVKSSPNIGLVIRSQVIANKLAYYGIVQNKTFVTKALRGIETSRHFIRGLVDGDGSVGLYKRMLENGNVYNFASIQLAGTADLLSSVIGHLKTKITDLNPVIVPIPGSNSIAIAGKKAEKIIRYLYSNCNIYLDRKYAIAKSIIDNPIRLDNSL